MTIRLFAFGQALLVVGLVCRGADLHAEQPAPAAVQLFEKEIRPLLVARCLKCHDDKQAKGGLKMTSRANLVEGGGTGPAIVSGKADESLLIQVVRYKARPRMPPKETDRLTKAEIDLLTRWVDMGAPWPAKEAIADKGAITDEQRRFWAFQSVKDRPLPSVKDMAWPVAPLDRFILARLEEKGLKPVGLADRRVLIRRATFDLIGLPPTPEEVKSFVDDPAANAFEKVIDRLLASKHYGERWGRHWLDLAHYADTAGETADFPVPEAWRYRNYVIDAFNADKPYDQFLREQVAGDLLAPNGPREKYAERVVATGFLAGARRFGFDPENYQHLTIEDTIDTLGKTVLGLTVACARCHDHKFDPVPTADYYSLYGILASTRYPYPGSESKPRASDFVPLMPPSEADLFARQVLKPFQDELARVEAEVHKCGTEMATLEKQVKSLPATEDEKKIAEAKARWLAAVDAHAAAKQARAALTAKAPTLERGYAVAAGKPTNVRIHKRGDPLSPGDEVPRRFLDILGGEAVPADAVGGGRLQLADWLSSPKNPLTARVLVNRLWQHHFGQGLVRTPSNFGKQGQPPTHPELLDYLASRFVESGWSIKAMHRQITLSRTYQLASARDAKNEAADPTNEYLWHFERRRLEAEAIRDALLAASGALDRTPGGAHPFPPERDWKYTQHNPFQAVYATDRRSVYLMTQRTRRHPFLGLFDGADPNTSTAARSTTTVPTQALFFLNSPFVHEQAARFAERLTNAEADAERRIEMAIQLAYGRPARDEEKRAATAYIQGIGDDLKAAGVPADKQASQAWASYARVLLCANEFIYVD